MTALYHRKLNGVVPDGVLARHNVKGLRVADGSEAQLPSIKRRTEVRSFCGCPALRTTCSTAQTVIFHACLLDRWGGANRQFTDQVFHSVYQFPNDVSSRPNLVDKTNGLPSQQGH